MCDTLRFDRDGHLVLQASEDKHAIYPSAATCDAVTLVSEGDVDIWGENCGWDPSKIPVYNLTQWKDSDFAGDPRYLGKGRWRFDAYNVGEADHWLVNYLTLPESWIGLTEAQKQALTGKFPHEHVWSGDDRFCGGLGPGDRWAPSAGTIDWLTLPDKCVDNLPGHVLTLPSALEAKLESHYRVSITTARVAGSGTDAHVDVILRNGNETSEGLMTGNFEAGDTDIARLGATDIGPVDQITIRNHDPGEEATWRIVKIVVERKGTSDRWSWSSPAGVIVPLQGVAQKGVTLPLTAE